MKIDSLETRVTKHDACVWRSGTDCLEYNHWSTYSLYGKLSYEKGICRITLVNDASVPSNNTYGYSVNQSIDEYVQVINDRCGISINEHVSAIIGVLLGLLSITLFAISMIQRLSQPADVGVCSLDPVEGVVVEEEMQSV